MNFLLDESCLQDYLLPYLGPACVLLQYKFQIADITVSYSIFSNTSSAGLRLILCAQVFFKHYICSVTMYTKLGINVQVFNLIIIGLFIDDGLFSS